MTETLLQAAMSGLLMGLLYALVAAGLSLIFGLMDVVNFAHGEMMMLAMYATFVIWQATGLDPLLQIPIVAVVMFALGVAVYRGLIARALSVQFNTGMVQIFVTFGLAIFLRGAASPAPGCPGAPCISPVSICHCPRSPPASSACWRSPPCC